MVSDNLLRSTVTNQMAFDQRGSNSVSDFERAMGRYGRALVSFFSWGGGVQIGNLGQSVQSPERMKFPDFSRLRLSSNVCPRL